MPTAQSVLRLLSSLYIKGEAFNPSLHFRYGRCKEKEEEKEKIKEEPESD
jgi:hypothetical protein